MERESMSFDVLIIGAGPAGLSAAIRLAQRAQAVGSSCSVCVVEKGAEVGAHILSGAVFEPRALNILFPDWKTQGAPLDTPATKDKFYYLTQKKAYRLPTPGTLHNRGNYIISLGQLCKWLAAQAEALGVEIYPGFAASEVLYDEAGEVCGVATGDMGVDREGNHKPGYQRGMALLAKQTIIAEGARGQLAEELMLKFQLREKVQTQTYGLGLKEMWEVDNTHYAAGTVIHSVGAPLPLDTYGGGFLYHLAGNKVSVGFVVGLDYSNPYLNPYEEFQQFKQHPAIRKYLDGGRCIRYGARSLNEGGWQSLPKLSFPGGLIIGCSAGLLNVPKIKGSHTAMYSGILAADSIFENREAKELLNFTQKVKTSWVGKELYRARNIRPSFHLGLKRGLIHSAIDTMLLRGYSPWTLPHGKPDYAKTKPKSHCTVIEYPKPDGKISFDKMTSVNRSNTFHEEDQPIHLKLYNPDTPTTHNLPEYGGLETRYCPGGVYEYVTEGGSTRLQINAQNCLHCKACDIKDPTQNIHWTVPEGTGGPNYGDM